MGLCKIVTAVLQTPIGPVSVGACKTGVHFVKLTPATLLSKPDNRVDVVIAKQPDNWPTPLTQCIDWLIVYFKNAKAANEKALPPFHRPETKEGSFTYKVWETLTYQVPCGQQVTYSQLAGMAGNPKACRAVGGAMRTNPIPILMPCHRVVASTGIGNYMSGKGLVLKKWLLEHEGVEPA